MAFLKLSIQEMASIVALWVDPGSPAYAIIMAYAVLKAYFPQIQALNARLLTTRTADKKRESVLAAQATDADAEHDFWLDAIVNVCDAVHPTQPDLGLKDTRNWLFPKGLKHGRATYGTEVGYAVQMASEITAARKKQLKAIIFGQMTLLEWVENWLAAAKKLGEIEAERSQPATSDPNESTIVRRAFLALFKGMESAAKVAEMPDDDFTTLFGYALELSSRRPIANAKSEEPTEVASEPPSEPAPTPADKPGVEKNKK